MDLTSVVRTSPGVSQTGYRTVGPILPPKIPSAEYLDHATLSPMPSEPVGGFGWRTSLLPMLPATLGIPP